MRRSYMVRWNSNGVRGFRSQEAAQQYVDRVCMTIAPEYEYTIEQEFPIT